MTNAVKDATRGSYSSVRWAVSGIAAVLLILAASASTALAELPDGRVYEMVSPVEKYGNEVSTAETVGAARAGGIASVDGAAVQFGSLGAFADAANGLSQTYVARRTEFGWTTHGVTPTPRGQLGSAASPAPTLSASDLAGSVFRTGPGGGTGTAPFDDDDHSAYSQLYVVAPGGPPPTWISRASAPPAAFTSDVKALAATADLGAILFSSLDNLTAESAVHTSRGELYEWSGGALRTVGILPAGGVDPAGASLAGQGLPTSTASTPFGLNAVSRDGARVFFQSPDPHSTGDPLGSLSWNAVTSQLYVREGDTTTLISRSLLTGNPAAVSAKFLGASADGAKVYFTANDQLTGDAPAGGAIYEADVVAGTLQFVAADTGATAIPLGISDDASRLYLQSGGAIKVVAGGSITPIVTGAVTKPVSQFGPSSRVSPAGDVLVFQSSNVTGFGAPAGRQEVYVYGATSGLACASCIPVGGAASTGAKLQTAGGATGPPNPSLPRDISADGRRVFFETADRLVDADANTVQDVYEYEDGGLHLISSGHADSASVYLDSSPSGDDVFFGTRESLSPADDDAGLMDVYDARVGGGFPTSVPGTECSGDACQGQATPPPGSGVPDSAMFTGPGNASSSVVRFSIGAISSTAQRSLARSGRLTLAVKVGAPGRVSAKATAKLAGRTRTVGSKAATAKKAATLHLRLVLSSSARRELARKRRLVVRITVTYSNVRGAKHTTLTLRRQGRSK